MGFQFNSPQDRFGLVSAGSLLAQTLLNNATQKNQNQFTLQRDAFQDQLQGKRDLQKEQRNLALKQQFGDLLGGVLTVAYDPETDPNQKLKALQSYVSAGGNISDVQNAYKQIGEQTSTQALFNQLGIGQNQAQASNVLQDQMSQNKINQSATPLANIPENALVAAASSTNRNVSNFGKAALEAKKIENTNFQAERKYQSQRSIPFLKEIDNQRMAIRNKNFALSELDAAIANKETGGFTFNNLARIFDRPELLTASGAQLISAAKELLVSNIGRLGPRPNQWVEQQVSLAIPDLGKSPTANAVLSEGIRGQVKLDSERVRLVDEFAAQDEKELGYVRGDIASRVDKAMEPYAEKVQRQAAYRIREIFEEEKGISKLKKNLMKKVPSGTPLTRVMAKLFYQQYQDSAKAIENAKKLGYTIYSNEEVEEVQ